MILLDLKVILTTKERMNVEEEPESQAGQIKRDSLEVEVRYSSGWTRLVAAKERRREDFRSRIKRFGF